MKNTTDLPCTTSNYHHLKDSWPSPIVKRTEITAFTQGLYSPHTLTKYARDGIAPASFKHGKNIAYHVDTVIAWLDARSQR